jgi:radical SAM protein with 4Fe4S-binding SPASM domain
MGNAKKNGLDVKIDADQVIKFVESVLPTAPFAVGIADNIGYFTESEPYLRGRAGAYFDGCSAGLTSIGIDSVGNVRGCESMYDERFIEGNLRQRSLREIWEDEDSFAYNRKFKPSMLTGRCADCEYGDICAGGCRSYNYFTNNGKLYENVLCAKTKG